MLDKFKLTLGGHNKVLATADAKHPKFENFLFPTMGSFGMNKENNS